MFNSKAGRIFTATSISLFSAALLRAQGNAQPAEPQSIFSNGVFLVMLCVMVLLLFVIFAMAEVVKAGAMKERISFRESKKKNEATNKSEELKKVVSTLLFLFAASWLSAQPAQAKADVPAEFTYWGMGAGLFYLMLIVILCEIGIALLLFNSGMTLLDVKRLKAVKAGKPEPTLMEKLNASVAVEEEAAILMDHDYDGIRELDNNLPPWWKYGFYATIAFAAFYLVYFHVLHIGKLSHEEYEQAIVDGDSAVARYKRMAPDLIDESNVKLLTDASSISAGKAIFLANCSPCHGQNGEGIVGPNFTDDYWLHGGSVQDVFKSVKYGWTDKGMKSWQQDLKPLEIQQVVSYVKSLRGTNPPNQKEKQGELYIEGGQKPLLDSAAGSDTTKTVADTMKK